MTRNMACAKDVCAKIACVLVAASSLNLDQTSAVVGGRSSNIPTDLQKFD